VDVLILGEMQKIFDTLVVYKEVTGRGQTRSGRTIVNLAKDTLDKRS
jgi:hypothetical protein